MEGTSYPCNKQSISSVSFAIKDYIKQIPDAKSFNIKENLSKKALSSIIDFINYIRPMEMKNDEIIDVYLLAAILKIDFIKNRYITEFTQLITINNFPKIFEILSKTPEFWLPILNFFSENRKFFLEFSNTNFIPTDLLKNFLISNQDFFESEDEKFKFVFMQYSKDPLRSLVPFSMIHPEKMSDQMISELSQINNISEIEKAMKFIPLLNKLVNQFNSLQKQKKILNETLRSKQEQKDELLNNEVSQLTINQYIENEKKRIEKSKSQFISIIDDLEVLSAEVEIICSKMKLFKAVLDTSSRIYEECISLCELAMSMQDDDFTKATNNVKSVCYDIIYKCNLLLQNYDEIDVLVEFFGSSSASLRIHIAD
ncbi:hypothetical protein TVAG_402010 [Trichomonas vaginalis G3]|uniref:Uncharacterized protein n=1 Tax=Trichomonas vaginalis (strain ATCC PRA-98 / G3) TaxID=412133 RepID=A2DHV8_TRIV3|nr:hypothetical protein TVAGG3_0271510 [Trichomonas vaginalis G3]EAY19947.1 hypothetical protein TVAG_402010 [Trichomonas vaginalis G3]KAI5525897.1 hypothetical protein TVAGG3_0271510 [Trichomonas vaginalis G3]|eukprot:XP_001580933.1 hypothetical protein [Trichomonas vaginalis G3]